MSLPALTQTGWMSPIERRSAWRRRLAWAAAVVVPLVVLHLLDRELWRALRVEDKPRLERQDWYRLLRIAGYVPTWIVLGLGVWLATRRSARDPGQAAAGVLLPIAAGLAGLAAELLKLVLARERPGETGEHIYRGLFAGLADGSNLGLPSSHAAVAFGAAFLVCRAWPAACGPALLLASGCGLSRVLVGAHFVTDTALAAVVGYAAAAWVWSLRPRPSTRSLLGAGS